MFAMAGSGSKKGHHATRTSWVPVSCSPKSGWRQGRLNAGQRERAPNSVPPPWLGARADPLGQRERADEGLVAVMPRIRLGLSSNLGVDVMSKKIRSFLLFPLVPAVLLGSLCAVVQAADAKATKWSDRATWPNKKVPVAGEKVEIATGKNVILDVSPPALGGLTINGKLSFADKSDLELSTEWILVHGELEVGTEAKPFTHKATITLTDNVKNEQMMGMGDRGIMLSGGTLNLHGDRSNTWTKLAKTADAGSTSIEVLNAAQWKVGDEIVLASTDYNPRQAERRTISAISGNNITLDRK